MRWPPRAQAAGDTTVIRPEGAGAGALSGSRISVGRSTPGPMPEEMRASSPARAPAGAVAAAAVAWGCPRLSEKTGMTRTARTASAPAAAHPGRAVTRRAIRVHSGLTVRAGRRRGHSRAGPAASSITGRSVADTAMLSSGISMAARPMLRRNGTLVRASAARLTATVMPEYSTEFPAVAEALSTAARLPRPRPRSSRQRVTMSSA